jgi:tRNA-splicing ligase RtcB (3'-phosphate/5'-hydroxy nucleic acid ligase)
METVVKINRWTDGLPVEAAAEAQLQNIARLPILAGPIAVMPDVHLGKGATVGSVIPTRGAIIPAAVGVDIGCGMLAVETSLTAADLPDSLSQLRHNIERSVPVGFSEHRDAVATEHDDANGVLLHQRRAALAARFAALTILPRLGDKATGSRHWRQVGSLGGGNHFIELCVDERERVWIMLHSGSRGIGNKIGEIAIGMAREQALRAELNLPDRDLAWLTEGTPEFEEYISALRWAQDYAALNRDTMLHLVLRDMRRFFGDKFSITAEVINCHHNYASIEAHLGSSMWITRKGAVSARLGEMGIIPGSMGAKSFIVRGKGNPDSYCSCSHGAGRRLSRNAAKKAFTAADLIAQTAGVECRKDLGVLDEIPGAYKDIEAVMAAQTSLVEVAHTLKQVMCIKG